jgi:hypothetical protein
MPSAHDAGAWQVPFRPPSNQQDYDAMSRAGGFGPSDRYKRCWQETVSSLFIRATEVRDRLSSLFYSE